MEAKHLGFAITLLVAALLIFGCQAAQSPAAGAESRALSAEGKAMQTITIGAVYPLTGEAAVYGLPLQRVALSAVEDINKDWAKKGLRLEILFEDGKCSGRDALSAAQSLVNSRKVKVILGGLCSGETLGIAPFAEDNRVLLFSPGSSSPEVSAAGEFVFRNYPSDVAQVDAMTSFIEEKGWKSIAILSENTDYAQALRKGYLSSLPSVGAAVVADEVVVPNAKDVRTEAIKIKAKSPDAIIMIPQTIPTGGVFARQIFESGLKAASLSNEIMGLDESIQEYKDYLQGNYFPIAYFENENNPEFSVMTARTKCELGFYCATGYDSVWILAGVLEKCGQDTDCMKDSLYATKDWTGSFTSKVSFDENGDVGGSFKIARVQGSDYAMVS